MTLLNNRKEGYKDGETERLMEMGGGGGGGEIWSDFPLFWLAISDQRISVALISRQRNANTHMNTQLGAGVWGAGERG